MVGAAPDLRPAGARRRVRPARRALLAARPPVVRLLRPAPDRPADVARDDRPPVGPLLPRLRADLLLPARAHDRRPSRSCCSCTTGGSRSSCWRSRRSSSASPTGTATSRIRCCARSSSTWATWRRSPRRTSSASTSSSRSRRSRPSRRTSSAAPRTRSSARASRPTGSARSTCRCSRSCRCWFRRWYCSSAAGW